MVSSSGELIHHSGAVALKREKTAGGRSPRESHPELAFISCANQIAAAIDQLRRPSRCRRGSLTTLSFWVHAVGAVRSVDDPMRKLKGSANQRTVRCRFIGWGNHEATRDCNSCFLSALSQ